MTTFYFTFPFCNLKLKFRQSIDIWGLCRRSLYILTAFRTATKPTSEYSVFGKNTHNLNNDSTSGESRSSKSVLIESKRGIYIIYIFVEIFFCRLIRLIIWLFSRCLCLGIILGTLISAFNCSEISFDSKNNCWKTEYFFLFSFASEHGKCFSWHRLPFLSQWTNSEEND